MEGELKKEGVDEGRRWRRRTRSREAEGRGAKREEGKRGKRKGEEWMRAEEKRGGRGSRGKRRGV